MPAAGLLNTVLEGDLYLELKLTTRMSFLESYQRALHGKLVIPKAAHRNNTRAMLAAVENDSHAAQYRDSLIRGGEQHARERVAEMVSRAAESFPTLSALNDELIDALVKLATPSRILTGAPSLSKGST